MRQKRLIVPEEAHCSLPFFDSRRRATERGSDVAEIDFTDSEPLNFLSPNPTWTLHFPLLPLASLRITSSWTWTMGWLINGSLRQGFSLASAKRVHYQSITPGLKSQSDHGATSNEKFRCAIP